MRISLAVITDKIEKPEQIEAVLADIMNPYEEWTEEEEGYFIGFWDSYQIGGRLNNMIKLSEDKGYANYAKIRDIQNYADLSKQFSDCITEDGEWYCYENDDDIEALLMQANPECTLILVDCHG